MSKSLSALAALPKSNAVKAKPFSWIKRARALTPVDGKLSVVEMKKAVKVLHGLGKSVSGIEGKPDGSFRVLVQHDPDKAPDQNPFDEVLE